MWNQYSNWLYTKKRWLSKRFISRLEKVTSEREQLAAARAQLEQDLAGQGRVIDELTSTAAAAASDAANALAKVQAEREQLAADFAKAQADVAALTTASNMAAERAKTDFERLKAESDAQVAILKRDAQIAAQAMQTTIDNLNAQVHQRDLLLAQVHAPAAPQGQGDQKWLANGNRIQCHLSWFERDKHI